MDFIQTVCVTMCERLTNDLNRLDQDRKVRLVVPG